MACLNISCTVLNVVIAFLPTLFVVSATTVVPLVMLFRPLRVGCTTST